MPAATSWIRPERCVAAFVQAAQRLLARAIGSAGNRVAAGGQRRAGVDRLMDIGAAAFGAIELRARSNKLGNLAAVAGCNARR